MPRVTREFPIFCNLPRVDGPMRIERPSTSCRCPPFSPVACYAALWSVRTCAPNSRSGHLRSLIDRGHIGAIHRLQGTSDMTLAVGPASDCSGNGGLTCPSQRASLPGATWT